jgi:hypothetical protein
MCEHRTDTARLTGAVSLLHSGRNPNPGATKREVRHDRRHPGGDCLRSSGSRPCDETHQLGLKLHIITSLVFGPGHFHPGFFLRCLAASDTGRRHLTNALQADRGHGAVLAELKARASGPAPERERWVAADRGPENGQEGYAHPV